VLTFFRDGYREVDRKLSTLMLIGRYGSGLLKTANAANVSYSVSTVLVLCQYSVSMGLVQC
jgi:hypothetical protein